MFPLFLFAQLFILLVALGFLVKTHNLITPLDNWLSFLLRCILWMLLTVDQLLQVYHSDLFSPHVAAAIQMAIVSMLLYSAWARVRFQRIERDKELAHLRKEQEQQAKIDELKALHEADQQGDREEALRIIDRLESERERDEIQNVGYSWAYLPHMPRVETVYRVRSK